MQLSKQEPESESVPTHGLLAINHAYNLGKITFREWLDLSRQWAEAMIAQYSGEAAAKPPPQLVATGLQSVIE